MSIHKIGSDLIRPAGSRGPHGTSESSKRADTEEVQRVERADRVEISAEGRELATRLLAQDSTLSKSERASVSARIEDAFYDDHEVAEAVAERLFASGDLDLSS